MSFPAIVYSRASNGIHAPLVVVEAHLSNGIPKFSIVGLPEAAVKESKERVRSALLSTRFEFPAGRITVNLAPADLPKDGGRFDLPIALGILAASGQIPYESFHEFEFAGELSLSGVLRPIQGALPFALATDSALRSLILPEDNADEASLVKTLKLLPVKHLLEVCAHLSGANALGRYYRKESVFKNNFLQDLADIRGQAHAKRALEVAAAGQHSLLMNGPPGTGKTMLACRLPTILPDMLEAEAFESARVLSISGKKIDESNFRHHPFRAPHHTLSSVAMVGGGRPPKPGEISLAHQGILFLDELPEFNTQVLEALREPLESGCITISRASHQALFPAKFQLVAAMNPCPCGYFGSDRCHCAAEQVQRYRSKISGPLLDRIDIHIHVPLPDRKLLFSQEQQGEMSVVVKARTSAARLVQLARAGKANAHLTVKEISQYCKVEEDDQNLLKDAMEKFELSGRAFHRVLKVARTIADLAGSEAIQTNHITEALGYRMRGK